MFHLRFSVVFLALALAAVQPKVSFCAAERLSGKVIDENGVAVPGAKLTLSSAGLQDPVIVTSDSAGRFVVSSLPAGTYELRAEKRGYYATLSRTLEVGDDGTAIEVVLNHQQEFEETVNVEYSAPVIDRQEAASARVLTSEEIIDLPFSATHDFRNALPLVPGIIKDNKGRIHMNGGGEDQAYYSLDGFNITSPVSGILENRISVDAIRGLQVQTSRYSAEFGKGSAGSMALESSQGDDHFRFSATNFVPSFEFHNGPVLSNWNPRATVSGPIVKGRAWYFNAVDLQYDLNIINELPSTANTNRNWLGSNLTRFLVNLSNRNILTVGFLLNFKNAYHVGISPLDPVETSRDESERFYFINVKDQAYFQGGWILETGGALNQINTQREPLGDATYVISPEGRSGNYFLNSGGRVRRIQALANVTSPFWNWHGRHSLKFGLDANNIRYRQFASRNTIEIRNSGGVPSRVVGFRGNPRFGMDSSEFSAYVQDRWTPNERVFVEAGGRLDWDQVLRQPLWSPRLAITWGPARMPDAKFSAGVGVFYDASNLELLTRARDQTRSDTFYDNDGTVALGPVTSRYVADQRQLKAPFHLNWSLGWEQKLPGGFYLHTDFIRKQGRHGWAYELAANPSPENSWTSEYRLGNGRRDTYNYLEVSATRRFKGKFPLFVSYARSSARSSAVLDYTLEDPVFGPQASGPLDWDSPNRLISWAFLPLPVFHKYSLAYFAEWHTGLPYSVVNEFQQLLGPPNSSRFPDYFSLNLHIERRFRFWHSEWALRAGFNNLTGHHNPMVVNNNIDSLNFGQFSGGQGRVFTGRIRFLGKN